MRQVVVTAFLLAVCAGVVIADGPETGVVTGTVVDAEGEALPGATVTIKGDRGTNTVITELDGTYRFALLTPGAYTLKAELEGLGTAEGVVTVTAGGKAEVELKVRLETADVITVTSEAPIVDKYNVSAGATVQGQVGTEVAGSTRTYYGVINFMPGTTNDAESSDLSETRPAVNGAQWTDANVFIDGVDTTYARYGASRIFLPTSSMTEVTLEGGGQTAEYGRTVGSVTNVIVKSGTNNFKGAVLGNYQTADWNADYKSHPELQNRENSPVPVDFLRREPIEEDNDNTELEGSIGGPIVRDKVWFFAALSTINTFTNEKTQNGDIVDASAEFDSTVAKLNFQPGNKHQLALSFIESPVKRTFILRDTIADQWGVTDFDLGGDLFSGTWNYSVNSNLFLETKLARQTSSEERFLPVGSGTDLEEARLIKNATDPRFPANPAAGPHWPGNNFDVYISNELGGTWHNGWLLDNGFGTNEYPRDQFNTALTVFGSDRHELRFGIDYQEVEWEQDLAHANLYSGPFFNSMSRSGFGDGFFDCLNGNLAALAGFPQINNTCVYRDYNPADLVAQGKGASGSLSQSTALYVRDRINAGNWTFNLGVRAEDQSHENDVGRTVIDDTTLSPRISFAYDMNGNGTQLLTLSAGRYYHHINQELINRELLETWNGHNGYDQFLYVTDIFGIGFNPGYEACGLSQLDPVNLGFLSFACLGSLRPGRMWELADDGTIDVDIEPYYKDELILGFEWQFNRRWAFLSNLILWEVDNLIGSTTQRDPNGDFYRIVENYEDLGAILASYNPLVNADIVNQHLQGKREYQGLQLQLNRNYANNWALAMNVTFGESEADAVGTPFNNTNSTLADALDTPLTQEHIDECQINQANRVQPVDCTQLSQFIGVPLSLINSFGRVGFDREVIAKAYGFRTWQLGSHDFNLGGLFTFQTGSPYSRTEEVTTNGSADGNTTLEAESSIFVLPRGSFDVGSHWWVNLSGAWGFPLGNDRLHGEVRLEVLNLTNQQELLGRDNRGEARRARTYFQQPRQFRLLGSFRF